MILAYGKVALLFAKTTLPTVWRGTLEPCMFAGEIRKKMRINKVDNNKAECLLYGQIGGWFASGDIFTSMLTDLERQGFNELVIRMHCYGGSVIEGNVIYNALQRTKMKVSIIVDGIAASMGCFILPAVEDVYIADNGFGMVHRPSGYTDGDAESHLSTAKLLRDMEANFVRRLAERTKMEEDKIRKQWFDGKDHWLNADEMVRYGLAKGKVPAKAKDVKILDAEMGNGVTAQVMFDRFSAFFNKSQSNNKMNNQLATLLIATLGLEGIKATCSDAEIAAAVSGKFAKLGERIASLEEEVKAGRQAGITALLDSAGINDEAVRNGYISIGEQMGVDALRAILPAKPTASQSAAPVDLTALIKDSGTAPVAKTFDWYQENNPNALVALSKSNPDEFKALYKAKYGVEPK